jgi:hypothetical protein
MPLATAFTDEGRGLVQVWSGVVPTGEILESLNSIERNLRTVQYVLADFTDCDLVPKGVSDATLLANKCSELAEVARRVAFVASKKGAVLFFRMKERLLTPGNVTTMFFRTWAEAEACLGVELPDAGREPAVAGLQAPTGKALE